MAAANMDDIAEVFKKLRFKKTLFGGVSQKDVWKKLENLQKEYRLAYEAQQNRYEGRLQERDEIIASLRERLGEPSERLSGGTPAGGTAHE